jgi:hypothetical protein
MIKSPDISDIFPDVQNLSRIGPKGPEMGKTSTDFGNAIFLTRRGLAGLEQLLSV